MKKGIVIFIVILVTFFIFIFYILNNRTQLLLEKIGEYKCEFDRTINYETIYPYLFHDKNLVLEFNFINSHDGLLAYIDDFDFQDFDLIISFGREINEAYITEKKFKDKFVIHYSLLREYTDNIVFIYKTEKNLVIADAYEYPF